MGPEQAVTYITACVVLQNIGIDKKDVFISDNLLDFDVAQCIHQPQVLQNNDECRKRDEIAHVFFSL
jgi:hypothetical protein